MQQNERQSARTTQGHTALGAVTLLTQDETLELYAVLSLFDEEALWLELVGAGVCTTPERPIYSAIRFNLFTYSNANAQLDFCFDVSGVCLLAELFAFPNIIITESKDRCTKEEGLAIMLHRLSFPRHLHGMSEKFGRSRSSICRIFL